MPRLVVNDVGAVQQDGIGTVCPAKAVFGCERVGALRQRILKLIPHPATIIRVQQLQPLFLARLQISSCVSEMLPEGLAAPHRTGGQVPIPNQVFGRTHGQLKALLAAAQRLLRLPARGDVLECDQHPQPPRLRRRDGPPQGMKDALLL